MIAVIRIALVSFFLVILCNTNHSLAQIKDVPETNPVVQKAVTEISSGNIKKLVETLASFGTRHTLSDTVSSTRGIGAARRWIKSEFGGSTDAGAITHDDLRKASWLKFGILPKVS